MIKVRFNLGKGDRYMKWKIDYGPDQPNEYIDPVMYQLFMSKCKLVNHKETANKIFKGGHKTVCAWVECEDIIIQSRTSKSEETEKGILLTYNPRIQPYWIYQGANADKLTFNMITTVGRKLYISRKDG
jgi:hypothetical protein